MIPASDLNLLRTFDSRGRMALTAYLRMDTPQLRDRAYDEFMRQVAARLAECGSKPECREAIREDTEIVGLYLRSNGHRCQPGLAIFSCAAELFWRAYPLAEAVPTQVMVGPTFDLAPLS